MLLGLAIEATTNYRKRAQLARSLARWSTENRALLTKAAYDYDNMALLMQAIENSKRASEA